MSRNLFILLLVVIVGGAALLSEDRAQAFEPSFPECGPFPWPETSLPVSYQIDLGQFTDIPAARTVEIINESFAAWEAPECTVWRTTFAGTTTGGSSSGSLVSFIESDWPPIFG